MAPGCDHDGLAALYDRARALERAGDLDKAVGLFERMLVLDPDDHAGIAVRLAALGRVPSPAQGASAAYVATLFNQQADVFDLTLVDQLGYDVPGQLADALRAVAPGPYARMLDLGCGTGLAGEALETLTHHRTGVDLAEDMIAIAAEKDLYDAFYTGDAVRFMTGTDGSWDLIVATDVLPYLGDLAPFVAAARARLAARGVLAFSSETMAHAAFAGRSFAVGQGRRFAHDPAYIDGLCAAQGIGILQTTPITVRYENGAPVPGHLFIARKSG